MNNDFVIYDEQRLSSTIFSQFITFICVNLSSFPGSFTSTHSTFFRPPSVTINKRVILIMEEKDCLWAKEPRPATHWLHGSILINVVVWENFDSHRSIGSTPVIHIRLQLKLNFERPTEKVFLFEWWDKVWKREKGGDKILHLNYRSPCTIEHSFSWLRMQHSFDYFFLPLSDLGTTFRFSIFIIFFPPL